MKLVNAYADKFSVKRLPWLLGNELQPSLLIDVGRYVGPADVRNNESLIRGKGVVDGHGWRLRFDGLTLFLRGGLRRRLHGTHRRERQRNQRCQQSPPQLQTGSPIRCSWLISSMNVRKTMLYSAVRRERCCFFSTRKFSCILAQLRF